MSEHMLGTALLILNRSRSGKVILKIYQKFMSSVVQFDDHNQNKFYFANI